MAEGTKPEKILEIVPDDAAERVLSDQAGDDDAHRENAKNHLAKRNAKFEPEF
jgi:hypothetical protein